MAAGFNLDVMHYLLSRQSTRRCFLNPSVADRSKHLRLAHALPVNVADVRTNRHWRTRGSVLDKTYDRLYECCCRRACLGMAYMSGNAVTLGGTI